jgi:hypothetical protein
LHETDKMHKNILGILISVLPLIGFAQEEAITSSGVTVLLYPDSTWKVKLATTDSTHIDTLAVIPPKPEKHKLYSDTATGFKGFLKPELKLPSLPEQSEGVYGFRVKVNKDGYVKEVITMQRGPNGQAESVMRNAITRMKFMPDGSIVPPLTEGFIRISIPPGAH